MEQSCKTHPLDEEQEDADFREEVEICDICGDAGYDDSLAVCIRCNESAEHIYCMATMQDTVPAAWVCESCERKEKVSAVKRTCSGGRLSTRAYKKQYADKLSGQKVLTNQSTCFANVLETPLGELNTKTNKKVPFEAGAVLVPSNKSPPQKTINNTASHYATFPAGGPTSGSKGGLSRSVSMKYGDEKPSFLLPARPKDLIRSKTALTRPSPCRIDDLRNERKDQSPVLEKGHVHTRNEYARYGTSSIEKTTMTKYEHGVPSQIKTSSGFDALSGSRNEDRTQRFDSLWKRHGADSLNETMKGLEQASNYGVVQKKVETEIRSPRSKPLNTKEIVKSGTKYLSEQSEYVLVDGQEARAVQNHNGENKRILKTSPAMPLNVGLPSPDGRLQEANVAPSSPCSSIGVSVSPGAWHTDALLRADPSCEVLWSGSFNVSSSSERCVISYKGLQAHPSYETDSKVSEVIKALPVELCLEELKRGVETGTWPRSFQSQPPTCNNIGVYFFPVDFKCHDTWYKPLLDRLSANDLALKSTWDYFHLLIFSSQLLPEAEQCWEERQYLWGIFKRNSCSIP